jgi:hypothetical protein
MLLTTSAAERATKMLAMAGSPDASATPAIGNILVTLPGGFTTGALTGGFTIGGFGLILIGISLSVAQDFIFTPGVIECLLSLCHQPLVSRLL